MRFFLVILVLLVPSLVWGNATCVQSIDRGGRTGMMAVTVTCTASGSASGELAWSVISNAIGYELVQVETWPGSPGPTDSTDLVVYSQVTTPSAVDLLGGHGANLVDNTTAEWAMPTGEGAGFTADVQVIHPLISEAIWLEFSNQAVNSAIWNTKMVFRKALGD